MNFNSFFKGRHRRMNTFLFARAGDFGIFHVYTIAERIQHHLHDVARAIPEVTVHGCHSGIRSSECI